MPNRVLKETIRTSRNVNGLTDFQFRIWIYLITYVDDYGRGSADAELLRGLLFPRRHGITEKQIDEAIQDLASKGMISLYEVDGEPYFYFPKWSEHQRVRQSVSKFPEPAAGRGNPPQSAASRGKLPQVAASRGESRPESNPIQSNTESNTESRSETRAPAREDVVEPENDLGRVMSYYMDKINPTPSAMAIECLKGYTRSLSADVVLHALQVAQDERKTGWSYIHAILSRYERDGLKTLDAVLREEQDRTAQKTAPAAKPNQITGSSKSRFSGQELSSLLDGLEAI